MANENTLDLNYKKLLQDFLKLREWTDELEEDTENSKMTLSTGIKIGNQGGRLIIEGSDKSGLLDVYIYFDQPCKENKIDQMAILLNGIHQRWAYGRFMVFPDGYMRWQHRIDFEGCNPTGLMISNLVQAGWDITGVYADTIMSVALTKQTAKDALMEFDEARESDNDESDDGPSEL